MEFNFIEINGQRMAEIINDRFEIKTGQDGLDIIGNSIYGGSYKIIIQADGLAPEFFDLKSGLAGEIMQKFSNYNCELAIVGDFSAYSSQALKDLIRESNEKGLVNFVGSMEEAKQVLGKNSDN
jgi:hypothetical protein